MLLAATVAVAASHQVSAHITEHNTETAWELSDATDAFVMHGDDRDPGHSHDHHVELADATCLDHESTNHDHPVGILVLEFRRQIIEPEDTVPGPLISCLPGLEHLADRPPSLLSAV
jgi:hypothetical protein